MLLDARRAFPCWDEPALKATYTIRLTVPSDMQALSNMLPATETANEGIIALFIIHIKN